MPTQTELTEGSKIFDRMLPDGLRKLVPRMLHEHMVRCILETAEQVRRDEEGRVALRRFAQTDEMIEAACRAEHATLGYPRMPWENQEPGWKEERRRAMRAAFAAAGVDL